MKTNTIAIFLALSAASIITSSVARAALTIGNHSFEANSDNLPNNYGAINYGNPGMTVDSWTTVTTGDGANGPYIVSYPGFPPNGNQYMSATMWFGGSVATTTYTGATIGTFALDGTYTLTMAVAETNNYPGIITLNLLDNGSIIASNLVTLNGQSWQDLTVTASSGYTVGDQIGVSFVFDNTGAGVSGTQFNADNVRLDVVAVPEPTSTALLVGGLAGLALVRRRRA